MKLAFQIAIRFLKSGRLQTLAIVLGIAVGVSVQVFIGSLINGLQDSLVDKTIGNSSQITISADDYFANYDDLIELVEENTEQITPLSPTLTVSASAIAGTNTAQSIIRGFDFELANEIYHFDEKIVEGRIPSAAGEVALGLEFKEALEINENDTIEMNVPLTGSMNVTVVGFVDFKVASLNNTWGISLLSTTQTLAQSGDKVSALEMQLDKNAIFSAREVAAEIENVIADDTYQVSNWMDNNEDLLSGLQGQSISSIMIQVFVMVSVVLAIASVLAIVVLQKSKQIGILKAMGIQNEDASMVFLFEGLILGILGAVFGILFGFGLLYSFKTFALNADGTPVVPLVIDIGFIALSAGIAIAASLLASLIPARKSSKLTVIEVIRNG
ncbi:MAG: FtsX-like permease family protein [Bacilli bacterium]|jgi:lipoprotein-releasing system permease protein|nr:FtsX-like permease family protein [Bacilli bacterium]